MRSGFEEEKFREAPQGFPRLPFETADFAKVVVGMAKHRWDDALSTRGPRPRRPSETHHLHTGDNRLSTLDIFPNPGPYVSGISQ